MFEKFKELFSSESLLDQAFHTTVEMLESEQQMFNDSRQALRQSDGAELVTEVKKADRLINKSEREVRRNVLTHLAISDRPDIVPGLALVTIVIDVERIGDYVKNIAELVRHYGRRLEGGPFDEKLNEIESFIADQFTSAIDILKFRNSDEASSTLEQERVIARTADAIIGDILEGTEHKLPSEQAAALVLYARYLKRINAHLTNVASSVVNPFPRIGFREKKKSDA